MESQKSGLLGTVSIIFVRPMRGQNLGIMWVAQRKWGYGQKSSHAASVEKDLHAQEGSSESQMMPFNHISKTAFHSAWKKRNMTLPQQEIFTIPPCIPVSIRGVTPKSKEKKGEREC